VDAELTRLATYKRSGMNRVAVAQVMTEVDEGRGSAEPFLCWGRVLDVAVLASFVTVVVVWFVFSFIVPRPSGDASSTHTFTAGLACGLFALIVACAHHPNRAHLVGSAVALGFVLTATAITLGREPKELASIAQYLAALCAAGGGLKYVIDRADARKRERRDRIVAEWIAFVGNDRLVDAIRMLEYDSAELSGLRIRLTPHEYRQWKNPLDQVLEFLLRLAHGVKQGDLDRGAVEEAAGWYFDAVAGNDDVRQYCQLQGYGSILEFSGGYDHLGRARPCPQDGDDEKQHCRQGRSVAERCAAPARRRT
jgi:hypothetical protein